MSNRRVVAGAQAAGTPGARARAGAGASVAALAGAAGLSVLVAAVVLGGPQLETTPAVLVLVALAALGLLAGLGSLRRWLIFTTFLAGSIDVSKALVASEVRHYSPGLYLLAGQALLLAWGGLWAADRVILQRRRLPFSRLDGWALGFLALVWWGAWRSPAGGLALATAMAYSLFVLGYYIVSHALDGPDDLRLLLRGAVAGFGLQAAFTAIQLAQRGIVTLPGIKAGVESSAQYGELSAFRPVGLFIHPNTLADWVLWLLLPALALVLLGRTRLPARIWWAAAGVLVLGAGILLVTLSRGGWAACLLGMAALGAMYARRGVLGQRHLGIAIGVALAALVVVAVVYPQVILRLTEPDDRSTESRLLLNDQAFMIIRQHLWLGIGYGAYNGVMPEHIPPSWSLVSPEYQEALLTLVVHNHYLLLTAELGLPAAVAFVLLLGRFAAQVAPLDRWRDPGLMALALGLGAAMVAHMLFLASDNYYADIRVFLLWIAAGLLQALGRMQPADRPAHPPGEGQTDHRAERRAAPKPARVPLGDRPAYPPGEGQTDHRAERRAAPKPARVPLGDRPAYPPGEGPT